MPAILANELFSGANNIVGEYINAVTSLRKPNQSFGRSLTGTRLIQCAGFNVAHYIFICFHSDCQLLRIFCACFAYYSPVLFGKNPLVSVIPAFEEAARICALPFFGIVDF